MRTGHVGELERLRERALRTLRAVDRDENPFEGHLASFFAQSWTCSKRSLANQVVVWAFQISMRPKEVLRDRCRDDRREDDDGDQKRELRPVDDPSIQTIERADRPERQSG